MSRGEPPQESYSHSCLVWADRDGTVQRLTIEVPEPIPDAFVLQLPVVLPKGQTAWIRRSASDSVVCSILECRQQGESFQVRFSPVQSERRRSDREAISGRGTLQWKAQDGTHEQVTVAVRDTSDDGLGLETPKPVPVHERVRFLGEDPECVGQVCFCTRRGTRYHVGVQLSEELSAVELSGAGA